MSHRNGILFLNPRAGTFTTGDESSLRTVAYENGLRVVEVQTQHVLAEQHAHGEEQQQTGQAQPVGEAYAGDAGQQRDASDQQHQIQLREAHGIGPGGATGAGTGTGRRDRDSERARIVGTS